MRGRRGACRPISCQKRNAPAPRRAAPSRAKTAPASALSVGPPGPPGLGWAAEDLARGRAPGAAQGTCYQNTESHIEMQNRSRKRARHGGPWRDILRHQPTRDTGPVSDVSLTRTAYWALARHPANRTPPPAPTLRARGNASSYCCAAALLPLRRCCMGRVAIASRLRRLCTAGPWLRRGGVAAHVAAAVQQTKCCRQRCLGSSDGGGLCEATSTIPLISGPAHGATVRTGGVTADLRCERPSKRGRGVSNPAAHCFAKSDRGRRAGEGFERELTNVRDWIGPCFLSHSRDFSL